ncbi:MAG TPA: YbfB/YjiJ family MFS transporter [Azospirillaceae bacterium]|nr:YbfB/YjiJ family MFS transporter [Azospirillaceae bacterium]
MLAMGIGRFAYTPILPLMQADTGLGDAAAGTLAAVNYLGYLLGAIGCGHIHGSRMAWLRASLAASLISTAGMALTTDVIAWGTLRLISGLASAGLFILATAIVLEDTHGAARRAGWHYAGVGLGIALSGVVVMNLPPNLSWRGAWLVLGAIAAALALLAWAGVRPAAHPPTTVAPTTIAPPASRPDALMRMAAAYFLEGAGYIVSATFLVAILKRDPATAAIAPWSWVLVGLAAAPSSLLWTAISRRTGLFTALVAVYVLQAIGIALPALGGGGAAALAGAVLLGGTFIAAVSLTFGLAGQLAPGRTQQSTARLTALYGVGQIAGPLVAGVVAERTGSFAWPLVGAGLLVAMAAALVLAAASSARGDRKR